MGIFVQSMRDLTVVLFVMAALSTPLRAQQSVAFSAADGIQIYGVYYPSKVKHAPIILLFHQADSSHLEYSPIAPRLVNEGFACLAIDQRSGDDMWGHKNQTVTNLGRSTDYEDALPDLEASLDWARKQDPTREIILWGSSYSASLVFVLASKHQGEIVGLMAFSPGEYFADKQMVQRAAAKLTIPVFITSGNDTDEIKAARTIFQHLPNRRRGIQYVPKSAPPVHGASVLRIDRDPKGNAEYWRAVTEFLRQFISP